ncbi:zincin [Hesseltinella vesiculosa]|uniref:Zincin n=1 Tax=Hesseltinella vesiculosa TaxID=101127 RepID=A0A1X2GNN8_9FUNG|nr:zincin [Hesseltinella vesiculosa]
MTSSAPPPVLQSLIELTADNVVPKMKEAIEQDRAINDAVASLPLEHQTYENIVVPLVKTENTISGTISLLSSLSELSPDAATREASLEAERLFDEFSIEQGMRHDLYTVIQGYIDRTDLDSLDYEASRMLTRTARDYRRAGLHLPEVQRNKLVELRKRLSEIGIEYTKNWSGEDSTVTFTKLELDGMDGDFLGGLKTVEEDGVKKYVLTMKYPDVRPVLKLCKNENTRRVHYTAYESRNRENVALLEETLRLRRTCAKILGYSTHADYVLEIKMAKEVAKVKTFLEDLKARLHRAGLKEMEVLKELKKQDKEALGESYDGTFNAWDTSYYERILLETKYLVNQEEIKKYFSLESTVTKMLDIYARVLGLKFVKVPADKAVVWHPDVQVYECWDNAEDNHFSGYMYLDLFPRDSKYPHAAMFPLQASYIDENGERVPPIAAMVANFTKPTENKPSLLKHDEVVTLFHELGHVMHHLCSRTVFARFHGTSVEGDFVEAPSQMLENWCFDKKSLKLLSAHYETGECLSDDIIEKLIKAKNVDAAIANLRQLFFGIYDLQIHTSDDDNLDTTRLYNDLRQEISLVPAPEGSCGQAAFGHLMRGYDAAYWGYMWSKVFSSDMFFTKFQHDTLSPETGFAYRKSILEKGGSRDGMDMLKDFLGREPSSDAFMREDIGVQ